MSDCVLFQDPPSETDVLVTVHKIRVQTQEQARTWGVVGSPTVRVNGRDIARELNERSCEDCGCGYDGPVLCRMWSYGGSEYAAAPKDPMLDAIRQAIAGPATDRTDTAAPTRQGPDHLTRFFAAPSRPCC